MKSLFLLLLAFLLILLLSPFVMMYHIIKSKSIQDYLEDVAIGIDQLGGTILYHEKDWTVSSWTYHLSLTCKRSYYFMRIINALFGQDHCYKAWVWESIANEQDIKIGEGK